MKLKKIKYVLKDDKGVRNPTEFSKFGHSSTLEDLQAGIKAVLHKYLIRSVSYGVSMRPDVVLVTAKATPENWQKKIKSKQDDSMVKFAVSSGVRLAYEPLLNVDGSPIMDERGNLVFKEIPTKESTYKKSLLEIFELLFNKTPSKEDLKNMWSFVGLVDLMRKYLNHKQIQLIIDRFVQLLWEGKDKQGEWKNVAQELERDDPELDQQIKMAGVEYLRKYFPKEVENSLKNYQKHIDNYYKHYGKGDRESIMLQALHRARLNK
jgi:hypothetical protein